MDELEMMEEEEINRAERPRSGGGFNRVLSFFLGIITGFVLIVGGVVGVGYYAYTRPIKKTVNLFDPTGKAFDSIFNAESGILNSKYAEMKVSDLISDLTAAASALGGDGSLADVDEISPMVGNKIDGLLESTSKYGIFKEEYEDTEGTGKKQELMNKPLNQMGDYLMERVKDTAVIDLLQGNNDGEAITDVVTLAICYGERGEGYTLNENGEIVPLASPTTLNQLITEGGMKDIVNKLSFETVLKSTGEAPWNDPVKSVIAYGPESHYTYVKDGEGKIIDVSMNQITYLVIEGVLCDDQGQPVQDATYDSAANTVTFENEPTQYLELENGVWKAYYKDEAGEKTPAKYKKTKVNDLSGDMLDLVDDIYLKDVLLKGENTPHRIMLSLSYGANGYTLSDEGVVTVLPTAVFRTIGDLKNDNEELINDIPLTDLMKDDGTDLMRYLLYGKKDVHYSVNGSTVTMNRKRIVVVGTDIYNGYGELLTGSLSGNIFTEGTSPNQVQYKVSPTAEKQFIKVKVPKPDDTTKQIIQTLEGDVYYLSDMNDQALFYEATTVGSLTGDDNAIANLTTRITVGEIMKDGTSKDNIILKHLQDETIDTLPVAIENLLITDVYHDKIYRTNNNGDYLDANGQITQNKAEAVKGTWKYLLKKEDGTIGTYTIQDMDDLISNMTRNMQNATLNELSADEMVSLTPDTLDTDVMHEISIGGHSVTIDSAPNGKDKLGQLTISEILTYSGDVLNAIKEIQNKLGT